MIFNNHEISLSFLLKNGNGSKGKKQRIGLECIHGLWNNPIPPICLLFIEATHTHTHTHTHTQTHTHRHTHRHRHTHTGTQTHTHTDTHRHTHTDTQTHTHTDTHRHTKYRYMPITLTYLRNIMWNEKQNTKECIRNDYTDIMFENRPNKSGGLSLKGACRELLGRWLSISSPE